MSKQSFTVSPRTSLADQVHRALLECIVRGDLQAGERLHDREWATRWQVSRTPIREAFKYLERQGLLDVAAARYTRLCVFTDELAKREAREWASAHASCADVVRADLDDLTVARLRRAHERYTEAPAVERRVANFEFFEILCDATPNFGLRLGVSAAAYRFCLAAPALPDRPRADATLQAEVLQAIRDSSTDGFRRAFERWAADFAEHDATA